MASVFTTVKQLVEENSQEQFLDAAKLLLKFADNVINNPTEPKYRKIRLGNPTVESKLLPVVGALECLFEMGFVEDGEFLTLPPNTSLEILRQIRKDLNEYVETMGKVNGEQASQTPTPPVTTRTPPQAPATTSAQLQVPATTRAPSQVPATTRVPPNPLQDKSQQEIKQMERRFFSKIQNSLVHVLMYEDPTLQRKQELPSQ